MKFTLTLIAACFFIISCKERTVKDIIDDGCYRYWLREQGEKSDGLLYFDNDGNWTIFEAHKIDSQTQYVDLAEFDDGDNMLYKEWTFVNDSTLIYDGHQHNVFIINDTMMILRFTSKTDCRYNWTDTLYAIPKKRLPPKYRKKLTFKKYREVYV